MASPSKGNVTPKLSPRLKCDEQAMDVDYTFTATVLRRKGVTYALSKVAARLGRPISGLNHTIIREFINAPKHPGLKLNAEARPSSPTSSPRTSGASTATGGESGSDREPSSTFSSLAALPPAEAHKMFFALDAMPAPTDGNSNVGQQDSPHPPPAEVISRSGSSPRAAAAVVVDEVPTVTEEHHQDQLAIEDENELDPEDREEDDQSELGALCLRLASSHIFQATQVPDFPMSRREKTNRSFELYHRELTAAKAEVKLVQEENRGLKRKLAEMQEVGQENRGLKRKLAEMQEVVREAATQKVAALELLAAAEAASRTQV